MKLIFFRLKFLALHNHSLDPVIDNNFTITNIDYLPFFFEDFLNTNKNSENLAQISGL